MKVIIHKNGSSQAIECRQGQSLGEAICSAGLLPGLVCGRGACGKCAVKVVKGAGHQPGATILACQTTRIPEGSEIEIPEPSRIETGAKTASLDLRPWLDGGTGAACQSGLGFAVDLGTTTAACYLLDLATGATMGSAGFRNPQAGSGADVVSRLDHAMKGGLEEMRRLTLEALAENLEGLLKTAGAKCEDVSRACVVGNTAMIRIFLGKDVADLAIAPFELKEKGGAVLEPAETGFPMSPAGRIMVPPPISAFVGPDAVAMLIACRPWENPGWSLLLDIGTNCEIALVNGDRILVCAAAAGPAFEGGSIENGMAASPGAITSVSIKNGAVSLGTIGGDLPQGICGSGLISAVSAMLDAGIIDATGRMLEGATAPGPSGGQISRDQAGRLRFYLSEDVAVTQNDIRELQLAKAAIGAGIRILCADARVTLQQIERVYLAGAFGSSLDCTALIKLGIIPASPEIISMGNAAATGAAACLISREALAMAGRIARKAESVNLAAREDFSEVWVESMDLGPLNDQQP